jgi:peptidoglycan hydrolase-like protein with peptidoglycan-binding domain
LSKVARQNCIEYEDKTGLSRNFAALYIVIAICFAVAMGAWLASLWIKSPAEVAAQTAPPRPSPILVPIDKRILSSKIITRGTARFGLPQQISLPPSSLKSSAGLITTLPLLNTVVKEGDILLTASGRPVFVLQGKLTAYRDLTPGISGPDVRQLEQALERLGSPPGPVDGIFDQRTSAAVEAWYEASGSVPFGPTLDQLRTVQTLEKELNDAQKARLSAVASEAASVPAIENARAKSERDNQAAAADLTAKSVALQRLNAKIKFDEKGLKTASKVAAEQDGNLVEAPSIRAVRAIVDRNNKAAAADLADKKATLRGLQATKQTTLQAVEVAKKAAAHNYMVTLASLEDEIAKGKFTAKDVATARIVRARAAAEKTKIEGELAVLNAEREAELLDSKIELAIRQVELAEAAVKSTRLEGQKAMQNATIDFDVAEAELESANKQLSLAEAAITSIRLEGQLAIQSAIDAAEIAKLEVKIARQREERARQALEQARNQIGIQVPVDEFIFLPELPVRVNEIKAAIGDEAKGNLLTVTDNKLSIDTSLPLDTAQLVKVGMNVLIDEQAVGVRAKGRIAYIADTPGTWGVDAYHRYINVEVLETNIPVEKYSLRLTIPIKSTEGEKIVVPVSSLSLATDGSSRLQVQRNNTLETITVEPGLSAEGFVQVTPVGGELQAGQLVVVGFDNADQAVQQ